MMQAIRAEFLKLRTIRSTYIITMISLILVGFGAFYLEGFRSFGSTFDEHKLSNVAIGSVSLSALFAVLVPVFMMAHEYRYNTISYTLTNIKSRIRVLLAKIIVATVFLLGFTLLHLVLCIILLPLGASLGGSPLPPQDINLIETFARMAMYTTGFGLIGLLFATIFRNMNVAITLVYIVPTTIETLIGIGLGDNAQYLPFRLLGRVLETGTTELSAAGDIAPMRAGIMFIGYMIIAWIVTGLLFKERDVL